MTVNRIGRSRKPDRLVTLLRRAEMRLDLHSGYFKKRDVLNILRREQRAQRARVTRIMKKHLVHPTNTNYWMGYNRAIIDILAKLHGRTP